MATETKYIVSSCGKFVTITEISDREGVQPITEVCDNTPRAIDKASKIILSKIKSSHRNLLPYKEGVNIYKGQYMNF